MADQKPSQDLPSGKGGFKFEVVAETAEGLRKKVSFVEPEFLRQFTVHSDEGLGPGAPTRRQRRSVIFCSAPAFAPSPS